MLNSIYSFIKKYKKNSPQLKVEAPKISIITSVYNEDQFISQFLHEITKQTIFQQCELLLINPCSPGTKEKFILTFQQKYQNIIYLKLNYDPGLYAIWNIGIKLARGIYLTNANIDDRVAYNCYEQHAKTLDSFPHISLTYSDLYVSPRPNIKSSDHRVNNLELIEMPDFSIENALKPSLANDHPMWRRDCHDKWGFFDEKYKSAGDYEMWLRFLAGGAQFKKTFNTFGIHYANPLGLSTNTQWQIRHRKEAVDIRNRYISRWPQLDTYLPHEV